MLYIIIIITILLFKCCILLLILDEDAPHPFPQMELNDLVRDLGLSKSSAELLASRLKVKKSLSNSARITFCRNRHEEYLRFFL